jgi:hypothetical protein
VAGRGLRIAGFPIRPALNPHAPEASSRAALRERRRHLGDRAVDERVGEFAPASSRCDENGAGVWRSARPYVVTWLESPVGLPWRILIGLAVAAHAVVAIRGRGAYLGAFRSTRSPPRGQTLAGLLVNGALFMPVFQLVGGTMLFAALILGRPISHGLTLAWCVSELLVLPSLLLIWFVDGVGTGLGNIAR